MSCESECQSSSSSSPEQYTVPIVGYEIVEERQRFTVYKIRVQKQGRTWFIFRRYSDFERLNEKLTSSFPKIELRLPPKRILGDNFNPDFIAKRAQGLQNYIKRILQHRDMQICRETREFFCLDDPPGPFDSLEESRAYVQYLEEQMEETKILVKELKGQLESTKTQLSQAKVKIESLECTLQKERLERASRSLPSHSTPAADGKISCEAIEVQLSDISDSSLPKTKSRKSVSFARTKAASEGNLLQLKNRGKSIFPILNNQISFRHSITFGEDSFTYNGFLDVEFHSNVTNQIKERKRRSRKVKGRTQNDERRKQDISRDSSCSSRTLLEKQNDEEATSRRRERRELKKEKRDSGIIGDGFTDLDF